MTDRRSGAGFATPALLPAELFADPVLSALRSTHRHLAQQAGEAVRYVAEVAPFAAMPPGGASALEDLAGLLEPGECVWVFAEALRQSDLLRHEQTLPCLQMVFRPELPLPETHGEIEELSPADADEMLALIGIAYPGFFRRRTPEMGRYFGVRRRGRLVAMGGERLRLPGYAEVSGLCTHPEHRGQGYAASLLGRLLGRHRREGVVSLLHVGAGNTHAIELYHRLGFIIARQLDLHRLRKSGGSAPVP